MAARVTDWGLAVLVVALVASGSLTQFAGSPGDAWVFAAHDTLGIGILLLLAVKLRRVWARVLRPARRDRRTIYGLVGTALAVAALISGLLWAHGATPHLAGYSLLSVHDALGVALVFGVAAHMVARAKPLRGRDLVHRRQFLVMNAPSLVAWRTQLPLQALLGLPGSQAAFHGIV